MQSKFIYLAIVVTVGIAVLSLIKINAPAVSLSYSDKAFHTLAYFVLGFLWLLAIRKKGTKFAVILLVILFGILLEILQSLLTDYRTFEYLDMVANSLGAFISVLAFTYIEKKQSKLLNSL
ncbi:VanZ family protein [Tenacibaculum sp. SZ-18]|uniref:VanZ family protein n=1 Tax=Tenacibaculum sp. SZ-18 TaxID=754423 RepID=UPI0012FE3807|nr:VanZ family protein [Tenacibaculum sp. SZ-18]